MALVICLVVVAHSSAATNHPPALTFPPGFPRLVKTNLLVTPLPLTSLPTVDNGDHFFAACGRRISLLRVNNEVAVRYTDDRDAAQSFQRLQLTPSLPILQTALRASFRAKGNVNVLRPASKHLTLVPRQIAAAANVRYAYPVLVDPHTNIRLLPSDELLVRLAEGTRLADVVKDFNTAGLTVVGATGSPVLQTYLLRLNNPKTTDPLAVACTLAQNPKLRWAAPNFTRELRFSSIPNDPLFYQQQALRNTGQNGAVSNADVSATRAWDITTGTNAITIAIIDDGVDANHPDLTIAPGGWDFANNDGNPSPTNSNGHGTGCAGIAAGKINNNYLIAGIAGSCRILPIKIIDDSGNFSTDQIIGDAIMYAADHADVLSDSWGTGGPNPYIDDAIDYAVTTGRGGKGCPVFFATGNYASTWGWGGSRIRLYLNGFGGDLYAGFYYGNNGSSNGEETVRIDNVCIIGTNGYDHLTNVLPDEDFEGLVPGWWVSGDAFWWLSTSNAFTGTGGSISAASPAITNGQYAILLTPLCHFTGTETIAFASSTSIATNSNFYLLLFNSSGQYVAGADLGNGVPNTNTAIMYPASHSNVIAVGASTDCDRRADYSEYDGKLDFLASSNMGWNDITTLDPLGNVGWTSTDYKTMFGGTSAACPLAAGIAALMLSANPALTVADIRTIMHNSCDQIGGVTYTNGTNEFYGHGRINAYRAVTNSQPDLALALTASPATVALGSNLIYTIIVTNLGPATASSVTVTNALPAAATFLNATTTLGTCATDAFGNVACTLSRLTTNDTATITITTLINTAGIITNTATTATTAIDANPNNNTATLITATATVGDGLPDWWRAQYFGGNGTTTNYLSCANGDADGTGQNNLFKYLAGLNPTNPSSVFRITSTGPTGSNFTVTWKTAGPRTNVVQATNGAPGSGYTNNFQDISGPIIINVVGDTVTNYVDVGGATNRPARFYRVRLGP